MPIIRPASHDDLTAILEWLRAEDEQTGEGFYCNRGLIERSLCEDDLTVICSDSADSPVGFLLGTDILEVQKDFRGKGYGGLLAEFMIGRERERGEYAVEIECSPVTSIPFWQRMGFTIYAGNRAYLKLPRVISRPKNLPEVEVTISFFPESVMWEPTQSPTWTEKIVGQVDEGGRILLPHEVFHFVHMFDPKDVVIAISTYGREIYRDKAKYDEAQMLGVRRVNHGFAVSEICCEQKGR